MKLRIFFIFLTIILPTVIFNSCSESSSPTQPLETSMTDYFPSTEGSWWLFVNYETDSTGYKEVKDRDSIYIGKSSIIDGKQAIMQVNVSLDNDSSEPDTTYFAVEGSKFYVYESDYSENSENPVKKWVMYVDFSKNNWNIRSLETHIDTSYVDDDGDIIIEKSDNIEIVKGSRLASKTFKIKGNDIITQIVQFAIHFEYNYIYNGIGKSRVEDDKVEIWYGKGVGIVKYYIYEDKSEESKERVVVDYHINPK